MPRFCVLIIVLIVICSCSTFTKSHPEGANLPDDAAWFDLLPAMPADVARESLVATTNQVDGADATSCSSGCADEGVAKVLAAPAGGIAWAYYRMPTNSFPAMQIQATIQEPSDHVYFGVVNWERSRWEFSAPIAGTQFNKALSAPYISEHGNACVAVVAYDGVTAKVDSATLVLDQPGWQLTTVAEDVGVATVARLFTDDAAGVPCIAIMNGDPSRAEFYRAVAGEPAGPEDWIGVVADTSATGAKLKRPMAAAFVGGRPALAYYVSDDSSQCQLRYCYATSAAPAAGDWVESDIGVPSYIGGRQISLLEYNSKPHLAYDIYVGDAIWLAIGGDTSPASDEWTVSKIRDDADVPALAVVNNLLAVVYESGSGQACYARTTIVSPNGSGTWYSHAVSSALDWGYGSRTELIATVTTDSEPVPLIGVLPQSLSMLRFYCADVSAPSYPNWQVSYLPGINLPAFSFSLAQVGGRPAVAYYEESTSQLGCAWAGTSLPAAGEDWPKQVIIGSLTSCTMAIADVNGVPAIAYNDGNSLFYVYYDD